MFGFPFPSDCQSMGENSEAINLPELFKPSGPHYYPVDGVCGFNVISKLFYCAYHKSLPEPLETELVKLCRTLATANPHF